MVLSSRSGTGRMGNATAARRCFLHALRVTPLGADADPGPSLSLARGTCRALASMQAFYSDHFVLPLPPGHRFPMQKYARLRERVAGELPHVALTEALPADDGMLGRVHAHDYVVRVSTGALNPKEQREIGFPWSPQMVERSRRSAGATLAACRAALAQGVAVNLAGGTHHAYADRGEGFCVFNDAAVAARAVQADLGAGTRVAIIDLDVHQGNGTAAIFEHDPSVFTLSLHGEHNYPFRKARSDLDVALPDGCGDDDYLVALGHALTDLFAQFTPTLAIYLAGADPLENDRLGRLALTHDGLLARDRSVLTACAERGVPVAIAMAGGYGRDIEQTVAAHFGTVRLASQFHRSGRRFHRPPSAQPTSSPPPSTMSGPARPAHSAQQGDVFV